MKDFPLKMRRLRELFNYSQEYVAYCLRINQSGYSRLERGKTVLSLEHLQSLADLYGVSPADFIARRPDDLLKSAVQGREFAQRWN